MKTMIGKVVSIVCIVLLATVVPTGCSERFASKTGDEVSFTEKAKEKAKEVASAVVNAPDETKADALDAAAVVLTLLGLGGVGTAVKVGANYFRNRKKVGSGTNTPSQQETPEKISTNGDAKS
ncbi:MAG: hypothetical protein IJW12_05730 [Opitutales bacterium]|nr:hypothetical protein [Opitutales bacterium]